MNETFLGGTRVVIQEGMEIKTPREIEAMKRAGQVVAHTLKALRSAIKPGITTGDLDYVARSEIARHGAIPSFVGYRGFPAAVCVSVNEQIVHGIPGELVIQEGDLVSVDVGAIVDGFHGDAAITVGAGEISNAAQRLIDATRESLNRGIEAAVVGARIGDISNAVQSYAEEHGFSVVREYVGHGIGRQMHEEPSVPNYGKPGRGLQLREGMALAIEPMLNIGDWTTKLLPDNWTVVTGDGSLSAHFEHSIAITSKGPIVMTKLNQQG
jgi:methionyl aminopeptidase